MANSKNTKKRANVRLRLDGMLRLKHAGMNFPCPVVDLSESGCLCTLLVGDDPEALASWRSILSPGRVLKVELTEPPEVRGVASDEAEVRWVSAGKNDGELDFGLNFGNLDPQQKRTLSQAVMTIAAAKLRAKKLWEEKRASARLPAQKNVAEDDAAHSPEEQERNSAKASGASKTSGRGQAQKAFASPAMLAAQAPPLAPDTTFQRQKRQRITVPLLYRFCDAAGSVLDAQMHKGQTVNFNEGGFQIEGPAPQFCTPQELVQGNMYVHATLKLQPADIACGCLIRSAEPSGNIRSYWSFGFQIVDMAEADRRLIREMYIHAGLSNVLKK